MTNSRFIGVIPCAVQREAVHRRHGIFADMFLLQDPVSAQRHYVPQRARDDGKRHESTGRSLMET
jgi:hypothetical protein